jgi:NAD(P)H-dependent flavin oxidoreductase YrpB (nitropropane dioxygenase family)
VILEQLSIPIVLAPLAGGPSTPQLAAAVSEAGGFGFLAAGYLTAQTLAERLSQTRALTSAPIGVNVFVPGGPAEGRRASTTTTGRPRSTCWSRRRQRSCLSRSAARARM